MSEQLKIDRVPEDNKFKDEKQRKINWKALENNEKFKASLVWRNIIGLVLIHMSSLYGLYLVFTSAKIATILFAVFLYMATGFATTGGSHRLWSHRSFKAKWPLRLMLIIFQTMAFQDSIYVWSRDHRMHHKYSDTNADPHNINRGFFFSHIGWLFCRKHPDVMLKGKQIDLSDLDADPLVAFQKKYYYQLFYLIAVGLPTVIPVYLWNETWSNSYHIAVSLRYVLWLNVSLLINSVAHRYGNKPYDKHIQPTDNRIVSALSLGEGWHNYHHTFPWDYKTDELANYSFSLTTALIHFFAKIGWAYDLKTPSNDMIVKRARRTGDGSHAVWGWGDKDQTAEERDEAVIVKQQKKRKANFLMS